jgi:hypothetical protein
MWSFIGIIGRTWSSGKRGCEGDGMRGCMLDMRMLDMDWAEDAKDSW